VFGPTTKLLFHAAGAIFGAIAVLFALSVWRLSSGPVSLAFLAPYVEEALISEGADYRLSFDDLVLAWAGWERTVDVRAVGVRVLERDGDVMAGVPEIGIGLSLPAMARGLIAPTRLELFGPGLRLVRRDHGYVDLGFGDTAAADQFGLAEELLRDLLLPPDPDRAMGYLQRISVLEARLIFLDEVNGVEWVAPSAHIVLERHEAGVRAAAKVSLDVVGTSIDLTSTAVYDTNSRLIDVGLEFTEVSPPTVAALLPTFPELAELDLPLSGGVDLIADLEGRVYEAGFDLSGGAGTIPAPALYEGAPPFDVTLFQARGRLEDGLARLVLDEMFADVGGPTVTLTGTFSGDLSVPDTNAHLVVRNAPARVVERYWPPGVTPEARGWVIDHIRDGMLEELDMRLVLESADWDRERIEPDRVRGTFVLSDATVYYQDYLPPAVGVSGKGRFNGNHLHADAEGGASGPLSIATGTVDLFDMDTGDGWAEVAVATSGALGDTLEVLNRPELGFASALGLDPAVIEGMVEADLAVKVPLREDITLADLTVDVGADIRDVAVAAGGLGSMIGDRAITHGTASVLLDTNGFDLTGEARIADIPMEIFWREEFVAGESRQGGRRIDAIGKLDEAARRELGVAHPWVGGEIDVEMRLMELGAGITSIAIDVDAGEATLMAPVLDWSKPIGVPANARVILDVIDGEIAGINQFGLLARDMSTAGSASRHRAGHWRISFDRIQSALNTLSGQVVVQADGDLAVALKGSSLDLRPYFDRGPETADDEPETGPPIKLTAQVDAVMLADDIVLHDVDAQIHHDGEVIRAANVAGILEGAQELVLRLEDGVAPDTRVLSLASNDAGKIFKALDISDNVVGGTLRLEGLIDDRIAGHPVTGVLRVEDFHVVDAPGLAKVLNAFTLTGAIEMLQGNGMPFDLFDAPFTYVDGVMELKAARATSISMGLTTSGFIDIGKDTVDVEGTIVPAYLVNTALSDIPLIGDILTGTEGEGIFAATYRIHGMRGDPDVVVNPLAALAPGILRDVFTGDEPPDPSVKSRATGRISDAPSGPN
jgi:hypothetical protein